MLAIYFFNILSQAYFSISDYNLLKSINFCETYFLFNKTHDFIFFNKYN